ncbi:MAG: NUDIX domain-containing protein [Bacteroidales bacterium]|nr:NUDIX domain-containing protein [Bacteroidales bacterium]
MDLAPVLPPPSADKVDLAPEKGEWFPIVEENGTVVARALRSYCHGGAKPLHPVIHIHIMDRFERLYLQKRSMKKDIQPGRWDTAVGGHVNYGEQLLEAVYREAAEELDFTKFNPIYLGSYVFESPAEKELVNVFAAIGNFELHPDLDEVDEGRWWTRDELSEAMGKGVFTPNFESEYKKIRKQLTALL